MIKFSHGDIFNSGNFDIYINTINVVGVMGAGIALQFKQRFPQMFKDYRLKCQNGEYFPGHIYEYKVNHELTIINFATKDHWRNPSQYKWIRSGLGELNKYLKALSWKSRVAIPALGCKNGQLSWSEVKVLIENNLQGLDHDIIVFEPW